MPIDWDATGSMLGGWATLAGAGAVAYAAWVGRNTFDAWKRQKIEERRIDAAERILTLGYRLRYNLQSVRAAFIPNNELQAAEDFFKKERAQEWEMASNAEKDRWRTAQAYLNRLNHHRADWEEVWTLKPIALAFFGQDTEQGLHELWRQYRGIGISADAFASDDGSNAQFSTKLRQEMWGNADDNPVVQAIEAAVAKLEGELLPVIRSAQTAKTEQ